jgi:hypothetical protein
VDRQSFKPPAHGWIRRKREGTSTTTTDDDVGVSCIHFHHVHASASAYIWHHSACSILDAQDALELPVSLEDRINQ